MTTSKRPQNRSPDVAATPYHLAQVVAQVEPLPRRFDLEPPEGTCYFATELHAAIRDASRLGPVTPQWVTDREVRGVAPSDPKPRRYMS